MIEPFVQPGATTEELDKRCHDFIVDELKSIPANLNYRGFPKTICTSVNHVVCHGIPGDKRLKAGDIINIDVTVIRDGFHGDTSRMYFVGNAAVLARRLTSACHDAMWRGIETVKPGARLGDIGHAIQTYAEGNNFSVVREYCGHGIGRVYHEDPQVLHYGKPGTGLELTAGMTFTIEPMINAGRRDVRLLPDGWTVVTKDQSLSAQWEHTILVTDSGFEVLTLGASSSAARGRSSLLNAYGKVLDQTADWSYLTAAPGALKDGQFSPVVFREVLDRGTELLKERFEAEEAIEDLVRDRARLVDITLRAAWVRHAGKYADDLALIAVGGYGRGELHPSSDIDIMVLLPKSDSADWQPDIERFLTFLWDIGLEVGHSVRSIDDCQRESLADISVATTLFEARLLAGPESLFAGMRRALAPDRLWSSQNFFEAKVKEQIERHHRYFDTAYNLEPNVKSSPGGLRDIQTIGWVAKRHFGTDTLDELVAHGFLTREELRKLKAGQSFLWRVRFGLHVLTGRREDRLLFDYQIKLAKMFGYEDASFTLAVEQLMQKYYRTVMDVSLLNEMLLQLFREAILTQSAPPLPINARFQIRNDYLEVTHPEVFARYPSALLELFVLLQQHPQLRGVRAETIRLIGSHVVADRRGIPPGPAPPSPVPGDSVRARSASPTNCAA